MNLLTSRKEQAFPQPPAWAMLWLSGPFPGAGPGRTAQAAGPVRLLVSPGAARGALELTCVSPSCLLVAKSIQRRREDKRSP